MDENPRSFFKVTPWLILLLGFLGFIDTLYLTYEYFAGTPVNCSILNGCDKVLTSSYSSILGVPLALIGTLYYLLVLALMAAYLGQKNKAVIKYLLGLTSLGFIISLFLVYLQFFVLKALCLYCMISALSSTLLFILTTIYLLKLKDNKQKQL